MYRGAHSACELVGANPGVVYIHTYIVAHTLDKNRREEGGGRPAAPLSIARLRVYIKASGVDHRCYAVFWPTVVISFLWISPPGDGTRRVASGRARGRKEGWKAGRLGLRG